MKKKKVAKAPKAPMPMMKMKKGGKVATKVL
jgi:hypothetical protein